MPIYLNAGNAAQALYLNNGQPAIAAYFNNENTPVFIHQDAPTITGFGLTAGSGKQQNLDINLANLPIDITMSATLQNAGSWEIRRNAGGGVSTVIAVSPDNSSPPFHQERLTTSFRPNRSVWDYVLTATRRVAGIDYSSHAVAHLRVLELPRLDSFTADGPFSTGGGAVFTQNFFLTWTGYSGYPVATGSLSQTGFHIAYLPSSRHLSFADGLRTGNNRTRISTTQRTSQATTLTLTYSNAAGHASRDVTLQWQG